MAPRNIKTTTILLFVDHQVRIRCLPSQAVKSSLHAPKKTDLLLRYYTYHTSVNPDYFFFAQISLVMGTDNKVLAEASPDDL